MNDPVFHHLDKLDQAIYKMRFLIDAMLTVMNDPHSNHKPCTDGGSNMVVWPVLDELRENVDALLKINAATKAQPQEVIQRN